MTSRSRRRMSNLTWNTAHSVGLTLAAAVSGYIVLVGSDLNPPLLGRLHPSVVHLPIGVFLLGTVFAVGSRFRRCEFLGDSLHVILALGTWSALLAVVTGSLLATGGGYDEALLDRHRWLGSLLALLSLIIYLIVATAASDQVQRRTRQATLLLCGGALLLLATGHAGGALTHGPEYLTSVLPEPIQQFFEIGRGRSGGLDFEKGRVYDDLIVPVFDNQCSECHGQGRSKGGLRVDTFEGLMKGGDSGQVVAPGRPGVSELVRRISLPPHDEEHMPPDGRVPLTISQTEVIRWWIQDGASIERTLYEAKEAEIPSSVRTLFNRLVPPQEDDLIARVDEKLPQPDPGIIEELRARGVAVEYLSERAVRLDVSYARIKEPLSNGDLEPLRAVALNVFRLDLSGQQLPADSFEILGELRNLRRLHLESGGVENRDLKALIHLQELEYLNLYDTGISDEGVPFLARLGALKWLYLWQSSVSQKGAQTIKDSLPELEVNLGS